MSKTSWVAIGVVVTGLAALILIQRAQRTSRDRPSQTSSAEKPVRDQRVYPDSYVQIGGVYRPKKDIQKRPMNSSLTSTVGFKLDRSKPVRGDENKNTRSVIESSKNAKTARRLSPLFKAARFDKKKFVENPSSYLDVIEAGRIWDVLEPAKDVPRIRRVGKYFHTLVRGESAVLSARTEPHMPVTFYSPRLGKFENQLSTITVQADKKGIAKATFRASGGTIADVDILAGSPVRSGHTRFLVKIVLPEN